MDIAPPSEYSRIASAIDISHVRGFTAAVHSVLDGITHGQVFVDRGANDLTVIVMRNGWVFPFGEPSATFVHDRLPGVLRQSTSSIPLFVIWPTTSGWDAVLSKAYEYKLGRVHLNLAGSPSHVSEPAYNASGEITIRPLDEQSFGELSALLDPWLPVFWGTVAEFATQTFGAGVFVNSRVVSGCWAGAQGGGVAEIDIVTHPDYRRRGYAELAARAFLAQCSQRGFAPHWSTHSANDHSLRLAVRLGFVRAGESEGYVWMNDFAPGLAKWGSDVTALRINAPTDNPPITIVFR